MADIADKAADVEQLERDSSLYLAQKRATNRLEPRGACYFCDDKVGPQNLFCDVSCTHLWEREQKARIRNGSSMD